MVLTLIVRQQTVQLRALQSGLRPTRILDLSNPSVQARIHSHLRPSYASAHSANVYVVCEIATILIILHTHTHTHTHTYHSLGSKVKRGAPSRHCGVPEGVGFRLLQGSARADRVLGRLGCDRHEFFVRRCKVQSHP